MRAIVLANGTHWSWLSVLLAVFLSGCATTSPTRAIPSTIKFASLQLGAREVAIIDSRDDVSRRSRVIASGGTVWLFGDDSVEPRPDALLRARLAGAIPPQFRDAQIELTRIDVGYWSLVAVPLNVRPAPFFHYVVGAPVGANVVGNLIGAALVSALVPPVAMKAREAAIAHIELKIDGHSISSVEVISLSQSADLEVTIEKAFSLALTSTAEKVDAMKYWERAK